MARVRKATDVQKAGYKATDPVHPLYGYIRVGQEDCAVEYLGEGPGEPNYEIMAPQGFHFDEEGLHTLLCTTLEDCSDRAAGNRLTKCTDKCA